MAYENATHEAETVSLKVKKFKLNNVPTCYSWSGINGHEKQVCRFLNSSIFGTAATCSFTGENIEECTSSPTLRPTCRCPLWGDNGE